MSMVNQAPAREILLRRQPGEPRVDRFQLYFADAKSARA
jgi:hypothetical protein